MPSSAHYRVLGQEEEDHPHPSNALRTRTKSGGGSCILATLLSLLILVSLTLAFTFFFTARSRFHFFEEYEKDEKMSGERGDGGPWSTSTTPPTSTEKSPPNETISSLNETISILMDNHTLSSLNLTVEQQLNLKQNLLSFVRKSEQFMERMTGVEGELLVPLFMLICLVTSLTSVTLCTFFINRKREARRRELFGKIITDLQAGDSEKVLLNHTHMDD